jgi:large repetitive protein
LKRIIVVLAAVGVLAGTLTGAAAALRFSDDDYVWEDGEVGTPYFKELHAAAGCTPYKFRILAGSLPDGLTLSSEGQVTGTPRKLGTWDFWIELRGAGCPIDKPAERLFTMSVTKVKVTIENQLLPDAIRGAAYPTQALHVVGGTGSGYTWSLANGSLPAGLTLNPDGTITGTPTAMGVSMFLVMATDSAGKSDTKQLSIAVVDPLTATTSPHVAEVGIPFTATVKATGGTPGYTVSASGLPPGLTFDPARGAISGTPTAAGTFALAVSITDAHVLTTTDTVTLTVVRHLEITTTRLATARAGRSYVARVRLIGGARPFNWTVRGLPSGIHLRAATGTLAGIATRAGAYRIRVRARDAIGAGATRTLTLLVR